MLDFKKELETLCPYLLRLFTSQIVLHQFGFQILIFGLLKIGTFIMKSLRSFISNARNVMTIPPLVDLH